jgi:hypothetical protein
MARVEEVKWGQLVVGLATTDKIEGKGVKIEVLFDLLPFDVIHKGGRIELLPNPVLGVSLHYENFANVVGVVQISLLGTQVKMKQVFRTSGEKNYIDDIIEAIKEN